MTLTKRQIYLKEYYQKNKQTIKETTKKNRKPPEVAAEYHKEYQKKNSKTIYTRRSSPEGRYRQQKDAAKRRNVEWLFTFETWWKMWQDSGKWDQRGRDGYMMCRTNDSGPYSPENVRIDTAKNNIADMRRLLSRT